MLKVFITNYDYGFETGITFMEEKEGGERYIAKPLNLEFKKYEHGDNPTFRLSHRVAEDFLKGLAESLDKNGVKTENDFKVKGLLEATKFHLEDMRKLVFKKK